MARGWQYVTAEYLWLTFRIRIKVVFFSSLVTIHGEDYNKQAPLSRLLG